jgi:hypothetical protein
MVVWWIDCELVRVPVEVCIGTWPHVPGVCMQCFATSPPMGCVGFASVFHLPTAFCGGLSGLAAEVLCASKPF